MPSLIQSVVFLICEAAFGPDFFTQTISQCKSTTALVLTRVAQALCSMK